MIGDWKLSRRKFIRLTALGVGALSLAPGCGPESGSQRNFLTDDEAALLGSIADQIIPPDEWPGGREGGVVSFLDIQLVGAYARFQKDYRRGLAAIKETCTARYHSRFESLPGDRQTAFLKEMESGDLRDGPWKDGFSARFFNLLRSHSLQGYYGSPRHGGNPGFVSYRMIGLDYPQIVGQNRYRS